MEKKFNSLNKMPVPKLDYEAYFVLNTISEKLSVQKPVSEDDSQLLHTAFIELQDSGGDYVVSQMNQIVSEGLLTPDQAYAISNHFFTERQLGTETGKMVETYFFEGAFTPVEFTAMIAQVSIPEHTKALIRNAYCAIKEAPRNKTLI